MRTSKRLMHFAADRTLRPKTIERLLLDVFIVAAWTAIIRCGVSLAEGCLLGLTTRP
jgi:hypothetical protein